MGCAVDVHTEEAWLESYCVLPAHTGNNRSVACNLHTRMNCWQAYSCALPLQQTGCVQRSNHAHAQSSVLTCCSDIFCILSIMIHSTPSVQGGVVRLPA